MRFQRLLVGALGAALLGALPVALATSPAQAGAALQTSIDGTYTSPLAGESYYRYGRTIKFNLNVRAQCAADDTEPYDCTPPDEPGDSVKLQRQIKGSTSWATVSTAFDASAPVSFTTSSVGTATYRIVYSGGTSFGYAPVTVTTPVLKGSRNPNTRGVKSGGKLYLKGNVNPGWGNRYVTIQKKNCKSCSWYKFKSVKTNRYGAYAGRIYAPRSGSDFFRVKVPATAPRYVTGYSVKIYETYQYRARTGTPGAGLAAR